MLTKKSTNLHSSSTDFLSWATFSLGPVVSLTMSTNTGGKFCRVWEGHACGVCCIIELTTSFSQAEPFCWDINQSIN